jgi:hypothetical protein
VLLDSHLASKFLFNTQVIANFERFHPNLHIDEFCNLILLLKNWLMLSMKKFLIV